MIKKKKKTGKKNKPEDIALSEKTRKKHLPDKIKKHKPTNSTLNILPPREYIFVSEYVKDWNSTRAFFCAYPSRNKSTANAMVSKLLKKPRVIRAVQSMQKKLVKASGISREFILEEALDTYYCSKQVIPIKDREGNPTGVYKSDYNCSIKCLELMAKMLGYIQNKVMVQGALDHNMTISPALVSIEDLNLNMEQKKLLLKMVEEQEDNTIDGGELRMCPTPNLPDAINEEIKH